MSNFYRFSMVLATALVLVAASGCVTGAPKTPEERAADAATTAQVEAALRADPVLYARHINVTVDRGVVRLDGFVWSNDDYALARNDASSVPGVKGVDEAGLELMRGGITGTSR